MAAVQWDATVDDSPGSEPYAVFGDLVLAVRTPRSRDFVTVEVGPTGQRGPGLVSPAAVLLSSSPFPRFFCDWNGEVRVGDTVGFHAAGGSYRLTLRRLEESAAGLPWIICDFHLERD